MKNSLRLYIPSTELSIEEDDGTLSFLTLGGHEVELLHCLVSVTDWEGAYRKAFLSQSLTRDDIISYIPFMCVTPDVPPGTWRILDLVHERMIMEYIQDMPTASKINKRLLKSQKKKGPSRLMTAERIYFDIARFGLPIDVQYWHFNRLMQLLTVCALDSGPPVKMSPFEAAQMQTDLNAERLRKFGTSG